MAVKYCNYENLRIIPEEIVDDQSITALHLKRNLFETIPGNISRMTNLVELNLNSNFLQDLPNEIQLLYNLEILDLDRNKFKHIPNAIFNLKKMKILRLFCNKISFIHNDIEKLENLEVLYLAHNQVEVFPVALCHCYKLKSLYLVNNNIKYIPKDVIFLQKLEVLELNHNKLRMLLFTVFALPSLKSIDLFDNQLIAVQNHFNFKPLLEFYIDNAFMKEVATEDNIKKFIERNYHMELYEKQTSFVRSLKEICCYNLFETFILTRPKVILEFEKLIPKHLTFNIASPAGICTIYKRYIFCQGYFRLLLKELQVHYRWQKEVSAVQQIDIFCSRKCFTDSMKCSAY